MEEYEDDGGESGNVYGGEEERGVVQAREVLNCRDPMTLWLGESPGDKKQGYVYVIVMPIHVVNVREGGQELLQVLSFSF